VRLNASKHSKALQPEEYFAHVALETDEFTVSLKSSAIGSAFCRLSARTGFASPCRSKRCAVEYLANRTAAAKSQYKAIRMSECSHRNGPERNQIRQMGLENYRSCGSRSRLGPGSIGCMDPDPDLANKVGK